VSRVAPQRVIDGVEIEDLLDLRLVKGAFDGTPLHDGGEVEEDAGDGGAGNVFDERDVGWVEGPGAVDVDAFVRASQAARDRHVDVRPVGPSEIEERGSTRGTRAVPTLSRSSL
jgi:hypothetical protein